MQVNKSENRQPDQPAPQATNQSTQPNLLQIEKVDTPSADPRLKLDTQTTTSKPLQTPTEKQEAPLNPETVQVNAEQSQIPAADPQDSSINVPLDSQDFLKVDDQEVAQAEETLAPKPELPTSLPDTLALIENPSMPKIGTILSHDFQNELIEKGNDPQKEGQAQPLLVQRKEQPPTQTTNDLVPAEARTSGEFSIKLFLPPQSTQKLKERREREKKKELRRETRRKDTADEGSEFAVMSADDETATRNEAIKLRTEVASLAVNQAPRSIQPIPGTGLGLGVQTRRMSRNRRDAMTMKSTIQTRRSRRKQMMQEELKSKIDEELDPVEDEQDEDYEVEKPEPVRKERQAKRTTGARPRGRPRGSTKKKQQKAIEEQASKVAGRTSLQVEHARPRAHGRRMRSSMVDGRTRKAKDQPERIEIDLRTRGQQESIFEIELDAYGENNRDRQFMEILKSGHERKSSKYRKKERPQLSSQNFLEQMVMNNKGTGLKIRDVEGPPVQAHGPSPRVEGYLERPWETEQKGDSIYYQNENPNAYQQQQQNPTPAEAHKAPTNFGIGNDIVSIDIMGKRNPSKGLQIEYLANQANSQNKRGAENAHQRNSYDPKDIDYYGEASKPSTHLIHSRAQNDKQAMYLEDPQGAQRGENIDINKPEEYNMHNLHAQENERHEANQKPLNIRQEQAHSRPNSNRNYLEARDNDAYQRRADSPQNIPNPTTRNRDYELQTVNPAPQGNDYPRAKFQNKLSSEAYDGPNNYYPSNTYNLKRLNSGYDIENTYPQNQITTQNQNPNDANPNDTVQNIAYPNLENETAQYRQQDREARIGQEPKQRAEYGMESFNMIGNTGNGQMKDYLEQKRRREEREKEQDWRKSQAEGVYRQQRDERREKFIHGDDKRQYQPDPQRPQDPQAAYTPYEALFRKQQLSRHKDSLEVRPETEHDKKGYTPYDRPNQHPETYLQKRGYEEVYQNQNQFSESQNLNSNKPNTGTQRREYLEPGANIEQQIEGPTLGGFNVPQRAKAGNESNMNREDLNAGINEQKIWGIQNQERAQHNLPHPTNPGNFDNHRLEVEVMGNRADNMNPRRNEIQRIQMNNDPRQANLRVPDSPNPVPELYQKKQIYPHPGIENLSEDEQSLKRAQIHSNPPEKVEQTHNRGNQIQQVQIGLFSRPKMETKSEELMKEQQRRAVQNRAEPPHREEPMVNMDIDVNIEIDEKRRERSQGRSISPHPGQDHLDIKVRPLVGLEINGRNREELVRRCGLPQRIEKIETVFENSDLNVGANSEQPVDRDLEQQYKYYQTYKTNMGKFLDFEVASEQLEPADGLRRLIFISKRGGVDKNYWLNYYCSLMRKGGTLNNADIIKGRLNCLSYSLNEYKDHYNHKGHQAFFNMGKFIYRMTKTAVLREEQSEQNQRTQERYAGEGTTFYNGAQGREQQRANQAGYNGERGQAMAARQLYERERTGEEYLRNQQSANNTYARADPVENGYAHSNQDTQRRLNPQFNRNQNGPNKNYLEGNQYPSHVAAYEADPRAAPEPEEHPRVNHRIQQTNANYPNRYSGNREEREYPTARAEHKHLQQNGYHQNNRPKYGSESELAQREYYPSEVPFNNLPLQHPDSQPQYNPEIGRNSLEANNYGMNFQGMHPPGDNRAVFRPNYYPDPGTETDKNVPQNRNPQHTEQQQHRHTETLGYDPNSHQNPGMTSLGPATNGQREAYLQDQEYANRQQAYQYTDTYNQQIKNERQTIIEHKRALMQPSIENMQIMDPKIYANNDRQYIDSNNQMQELKLEIDMGIRNNPTSQQEINGRPQAGQMTSQDNTITNAISPNQNHQSESKVNLDIQRIDNTINSRVLEEAAQDRKRMIESDLNSEEAREVEDIGAIKRRTRSRARSSARERLASGNIGARTDKELKLKMEMEMKMGEEEDDDVEESILEEDEEYEQEIPQTRPKPVRKKSKQNIKSEIKKNKVKIETHIKKTGLIKQSSNGKLVENKKTPADPNSKEASVKPVVPQEPLDDDSSKEWREYFGKVEYQALEPGSRAYNKISLNFAFELKDVLTMQDKFNDELFQRENEDMMADLSLLNQPAPFSKYLLTLPFKEDFKAGHQQLENERVRRPKIQKLGILRRLVLKYLKLNVSIIDMIKFTDIHQNYENATETIKKRCEATKQYLSSIRLKRLGVEVTQHSGEPRIDIQQE